MLVKIQPRRRRAISLTPLIDVVFILLVFFMLASNFADWREYEVATAANPSRAAASDNPPQRLAISASGWQLGNTAFSSLAAVETELRALQQQNAELTVVIQPAADVPVQQAMDALDLAKRLGISRVSLRPAAGALLP